MRPSQTRAVVVSCDIHIDKTKIGKSTMSLRCWFRQNPSPFGDRQFLVDHPGIFFKHVSFVVYWLVILHHANSMGYWCQKQNIYIFVLASCYLLFFFPNDRHNGCFFLPSVEFMSILLQSGLNPQATSNAGHTLAPCLFRWIENDWKSEN